MLTAGKRMGMGNHKGPKNSNANETHNFQMSFESYETLRELLATSISIATSTLTASFQEK